MTSLIKQSNCPQQTVYFPLPTMICPYCGAELKNGATFCPHCGSDKNTGWKEGAEYSDLDLPDYDEIVENEFGEKKKKSSPLAIAAAIIVALAFIATMIF